LVLSPSDGAEEPVGCEDFDDPKRPTEPIPNAVLFLRQPNTYFDASPWDIHQGKLGDCYIMATQAALATTAAGRALLKNAITENRNERGELVSYSVTLYKPTGTGSRPALVATKVEVDARFVQGHSAPAPAGIPGDTRQEVWPVVIEKACAAALGSYTAIACGGPVETAMAMLTGHWPDHNAMRWPFAYNGRDLVRDLAAQNAVVLATRSDAELASARRSFPDESENIAAHHAYTVLAARTKDGDVQVALYNPWGQNVARPKDKKDPKDQDEPTTYFWISAKHLRAWFATVDVTGGQ
jgi:hypothetical protein